MPCRFILPSVGYEFQNCCWVHMRQEGLGSHDEVVRVKNMKQASTALMLIFLFHGRRDLKQWKRGLQSILLVLSMMYAVGLWILIFIGSVCGMGCILNASDWDPGGGQLRPLVLDLVQILWRKAVGHMCVLFSLHSISRASRCSSWKCRIMASKWHVRWL